VEWGNGPIGSSFAGSAAQLPCRWRQIQSRDTRGRGSGSLFKKSAVNGGRSSSFWVKPESSAGSVHFGPPPCSLREPPLRLQRWPLLASLCDGATNTPRATPSLHVEGAEATLGAVVAAGALWRFHRVFFLSNVSAKIAQTLPRASCGYLVDAERGPPPPSLSLAPLVAISQPDRLALKVYFHPRRMWPWRTPVSPRHHLSQGGGPTAEHKTSKEILPLSRRKKAHHFPPGSRRHTLVGEALDWANNQRADVKPDALQEPRGRVEKSRCPLLLFEIGRHRHVDG